MEVVSVGSELFFALFIVLVMILLAVSLVGRGILDPRARVYLSAGKNVLVTIRSDLDNSLSAYKLSNHVVAKIGVTTPRPSYFVGPGSPTSVPSGASLTT